VLAHPGVIVTIVYRIKSLTTHCGTVLLMRVVPRGCVEKYGSLDGIGISLVGTTLTWNFLFYRTSSVVYNTQNNMTTGELV
jgi:hypothetical protein